MKMKWVKSLMLNDDEKIEARLFQILTYFEKMGTENKCVLNDIDATGNIGNILTMLINVNDRLIINLKMLIAVAIEPGQIFELQISCEFVDANFQLVIRDGQHFDVLGDSPLNDQILGAFTYGQIDNYESS